MSRLVQQRRGKGGSNFRSPRNGTYALDRYSEAQTGSFIVEDIFHEPGRNTPGIRLRAGQKVAYAVAMLGMYVGQSIKKGALVPGAVLHLRDVPYGRPISCVENTPGGKIVYARSAGVHAMVVEITQKTVTIKLNKRFITLNADCLATYGIPAGGGQKLKPVGKAGTAIHRLQSKAKKAYSVSAKKKNISDHPFGSSKAAKLGRKKCAARHAPPGAKVGNIAAKRCGRK